MTTLPALKLELRAVHYSPALSRETNAFAADVWIDGKPGFHVRNDGQGGCDFHEPVKGQSYAEMNAQLAAVGTYANTLPARRYGPADHQVVLEENVDSLVAGLLSDWILTKDVKRKLAKKMTVTMKGKPGIFSFRVPYDPAVVPSLRAKYPEIDKILNELPFEEALAIWKADAKNS